MANMQAYAEQVRSGPRGLLSRGDLERISAHIDDALVAAPHLTAWGAQSLVDVGTGAGLPGLPLAMALPELHTHLIESLRWKCDFLRDACVALDLVDRVEVHQCRAEEAVDKIQRESIDIGVCRALAAPPAALEYLAPLVRVGGRIVLWTTRERLDSGKPSSRTTELLGLKSAPEIVPAPSQLRDAGILACWDRIAPCHTSIPRRVGLATRKPL